MLTRLALLVIAFALLEGLATASCTPGYAGSGYYRLPDCGLRLGHRAYPSSGYAYSPGYGYGYGHTIDAFIPTLYGPPLSYGYPSAVPYIPNWYAAPYMNHQRHHPRLGRGVVPGFRSSPRSVTRVRPQRRSSNTLPGIIRPGLRRGFANRFEARTRSRSRRNIAQLSSGVWINE